MSSREDKDPVPNASHGGGGVVAPRFVAPQAVHLPLLRGALPALPGLVSGLLQQLSRSALSAFHHVCFEGDRVLQQQNRHTRQLVITYLPSKNLSFSSGSVAWGSTPTASLIASSPGKASSTASGDASIQSTASSPPASSTGPAFIGQVFTMCDASRRGLIAVRPVDSQKTKKVPYMPSFVPSKFINWVDKALGNVNKDETEGPIFRFYFDKDDAGAYVKQLGLAGSMVGSCPLDAAYKYYKGKPPMFRFIPDRKQVKVAKKLLRKDRGGTVARMFKGVPVFTARNLTIAMSTPSGVRWFTPYFFDKQHLDKLIGHSVDHYYHMLIHARRTQRHNQVVDEFPGDQPEDDPDGLMDPPEVQEFMEEMGQGGSPIFDSVLFKAAEVQFQDMVDNVILGNRLSRRLAGLQPSFPVLVDSFERRAAAAEGDPSNGPKSSVVNSEQQSKREDETCPRDAGHDDEGSTSSRTDSAEFGLSGKRVQKPERASRAPFQLFGRNWGFHSHGGQKPEVPDDFQDEKLQADRPIENLGSRCTETGHTGTVRKEEVIERIQPKLTMMGIAMTEPETNMTDAVLQKAMAAAAKDIENRVRKGEGSGQEHGPLFIADLGGPPEIWGREASTFQGWDSDDED